MQTIGGSEKSPFDGKAAVRTFNVLNHPIRVKNASRNIIDDQIKNEESENIYYFK